MFRFACALLALLLIGCTSSRKISKVGLREPATALEEAVVSPVRAEILAASSLPKACPAEIRARFVPLSGERVNFPSCPEALADRIQASLPFLKLEERSTLEEVLNSQCRSLGATEFGDSLETLVNNFDSTGPIGRRAKIEQTVASQESDLKTLEALKETLKELVDYHLPLDRWVRRNGEFLLPEEDLGMLHRLILKNSCRMSEQELEIGYSTIRTLEEFANICRDEEQKKLIAGFLKGMNQLIEQKLKEFFYP